MTVRNRDLGDSRALDRREFLRQSGLTVASFGTASLGVYGRVSWTEAGECTKAARRQNARVWMTYVNVMSSVDEDFRDMKAHGVDAVEINVYDAIWVGDEIDLAEALRCARNHELLLGFTLVNISLRADRVKAHGYEPVPAVMIGGAYQGKGIDWHRFPFSPTRHEILIEKPIFGSDWTLGDGKYFAEILPPHKAEVIVKKADYDGRQHLAVVPAMLSPAGENTYLMSFDLTGVRGDLANVMLAVYWRMRGPIFRQPQPANYFGNTSSPHAEATRKGLRAEVRYQIDRWRQANRGTFPDDVVIGLRGPGDEDFLQTVPNGPVNDAQSLPLWDYCDEAIADFQRLNPQDEYPRHWTYRGAFGETAYADWLWSLHRACADLVRITKNTLCDEGLSHLLLYRANLRCDVFYVGNDHGGMGAEMVVKELDVVSADPYPSDARGYNGGLIPHDMSYMAGLARRHRKELMPWLQGHNGPYPPPEHLREIHRQHMGFEPHRICYLGYGKRQPPPVGSDTTFPLGNPASWEEAKRLNAEFRRRAQRQINVRIAAIRDYRVWGVKDFGGQHWLDRFLTDILGYISVRHSISYDPVETRSLETLDWTSVYRYGLVLAALPVFVSAAVWEELSKLPGRALLLCPDCQSLDKCKKITGARLAGETVPAAGQRITTEHGSTFGGLYIRPVEADGEVEVLGRFGDKVCMWRRGNLVLVSARIEPRETGPFVEWIASHGCPELVGRTT